LTASTPARHSETNSGARRVAEHFGFSLDFPEIPACGLPECYAAELLRSVAA